MALRMREALAGALAAPGAAPPSRSFFANALGGPSARPSSGEWSQGAVGPAGGVRS